MGGGKGWPQRTMVAVRRTQERTRVARIGRRCWCWRCRVSPMHPCGLMHRLARAGPECACLLPLLSGR
jgi:hypothetical protein